MIAKTSLLLILFSISTIMLSAQIAEISGKVTDEETGEELIYANLVLEKDGVFANGVSTDFDGNYSLQVDPGTYVLKISYTGYPDRVIEGIELEAGKNLSLDIVMEQSAYVPICVCHPYHYFFPLIEMDNTTSGKTMGASVIRNIPTKNVNELSALAPGVSIEW